MNTSHIALIPTGIIRGLSSRLHRLFEKGQYPTFLLLSVTDRCNCRCAMCHIWQKKDIHDISREEYKKIFKDSLWKKLQILSLTGGEPFLRKDIDEVILDAVDTLPSLNRISTPTNGLTPERIEEKVRKIMENLPPDIVFKVGVSIDGLKETHDKLRGVPGAFEKATETVKRLKKVNFPNFEVGILSLITCTNVAQLNETHRAFRRLTDKITYTLSTDAEFFGGQTEECRLDAPGIRERVIQFINRVLIPGYPEKSYLYHKYKDHLIKKRRTYPCLAGYRSSYIDSDGNLFPCHYLDNQFALANVLDILSPEQKDKLIKYETLEEAWFSGEASKMRKRLKKHPYCLNCSNNCDSRNLIREDFWNFFAYLVTHPSVPVKALLKKRD